MKKINKKGFTLVELLVVLGIICVLALIITPAIINYRSKANNSYNEKLQENIFLIARDYYTNNRNELPNGQKEGKYVDILTLDEMKKNNLFTNDIIDAYKNNCSSDSYVVVENNRGNYDYYLCLKCGDKTYETDKSYCDFKEGIGNAPTCNLTYNDGWSKENVLITITSTDSVGLVNIKNNGKAIKTTYDENTKTYKATYEVSKSGIYNFDILNKYGLKTSCKTEKEIKIDKDSPRCLISKQDKTSASLNLLVTAVDDTSSVKSIVIGQTTLGSDNLYKVTSNGKYVATVIDNAGNVGTCSVDVTEIDNESPTIEATSTSSSSITAVMKDNVGVVEYQITTSSTPTTSWTKIDSTTSITKTFSGLSSSTNYYIYAKDAVGNVGSIKVTTKSGGISIVVPDNPDPTPPSGGGTSGGSSSGGSSGGSSSGGTTNPGTGAGGSSGGGMGACGANKMGCTDLEFN